MVEYCDGVDGITPDLLAGVWEGWPMPPSSAAHLSLLAGSDDLVCDEDLVPFCERFGMVRHGAMILRQREAPGRPAD